MEKNKSQPSFALFLGPLLAFILGTLLFLYGWSFAAIVTASVTALCATWWVFEPIPIPATSLLPLALFPLFGVLNKSQVAESYGSPLILLLLAGFILSKALEKSGAHRRLALNMIHLFGGHNPKRLVFGFMVASAVLSMWISNTATTLMLLPVALAALEGSKDKELTPTLLLAIAYSASLGGLGTPIGTPPNLIFVNVYQESTGKTIDFIQWMSWAVPVVCLFLPLMGLRLTRNLKSQESFELPCPGPWRREEIRTLAVFSLTALAWVTIKNPFGGWSQLFGITTANYSAVGLTAVVFMFLIPNGHGGRLLDWERAETIPWGILLLFSGGIALAKAFMITGLSASLGQILAGLSSLHLILLTLIICLSVSFLTEITSNTATTTLLMPVLAAVALSAKFDPMILMVPAAMSASCAFMLPVATAPNAVVFSSKKIAIKTMVHEGFTLNIIGAFVITLVCYFLL